MTKDIIEKIGNSLIQHGKLNDRVYIMKLSEYDVVDVVSKAHDLVEENGYTKIFVKASNDSYDYFLSLGFEIEAEIPEFFNGQKDCIFLAKYFDANRAKIVNLDELEKVLNISLNKSQQLSLKQLSDKYIINDLKEENAVEMTNVYKKVFKSYPFPIFDDKYLVQTMQENIKYAGIWHDDKLVGIASAETSQKDKNSEMTDFAVLPEYRGEGFALHLLKYLEEKLKKENYKTLYTIARAKSVGMNATFRKSGYYFSGTLKNNTQISGEIESMNVWYKSLS
jgi:putative beta-lysine N-acetyltransferase